MEQNVRVSVVCNVYNHAPYLRSALDGFVMQQTDFPFEVLIHDDASTDGSQDIIREYEEKYPDIIKPIYQTENQYSQKIPINLTYQIPRIKGKYVAVCEGDDYWTDPLKLQKQHDFLATHPDYSMCVCSTLWLDMRTGKMSKKSFTTEDRDVPIDEIILEIKGRPFQYGSFFAIKEVFTDRPEWMGLFGVGDTPMALHAAIRGKVRFLADVMTVYRNNAAGSWTSRVAKNASFKVASFQKMIGGYEAFNKATDFQYDEAVSLRIKRLGYFIARAKRDLKAMRSGALREVYLSRSRKARMMDVLACKAPALNELVLRLFR